MALNLTLKHTDIQEFMVKGAHVNVLGGRDTNDMFGNVKKGGNNAPLLWKMEGEESLIQTCQG